MLVPKVAKPPIPAAINGAIEPPEAIVTAVPTKAGTKDLKLKASGNPVSGLTVS